MPEISANLGMSGPTVLQMVKELKEIGFVEEIGELKSTGGRKAKAIGVAKNKLYSAGVSITANHISMLLIDFSTKIINHVRISKKFRDEDSYYVEMFEELDKFLDSIDIALDVATTFKKNEQAVENINSKLDKNKIIGVGIAIPGIVDRDKNEISYSRALNVVGKPCEAITKHSPYPSVVINDANAAALTECVADMHQGNKVYLSLSNTVGGAIILKRKFDTFAIANDVGASTYNMYAGDEWKSGEFGHMVIHPHGNTCYCGKVGCIDAYCSALRLEEFAKGKLEEFFIHLKNGEEEYVKRFDDYLNEVAIAIDNLRMAYDCDVILGGYVGSFMKPYLKVIREKVGKKNIFGSTGNYVKVCKYKIEAAALGSALYQLEKYVELI
jgi:predicted NBD/HSP70 family sugar kinase